MREYHKIDSIFKRDERGNFFIGEWSRPEFGYLADNEWVWTEKVDGTNIRIMYHCQAVNAKHYEPYDGYDHWIPRLEFGGKTDNAQIPAKLVQYLQDTFNLDRISEVFGPAGQDGKGLDTQVCLYGEGYGAGIQKGGGNYSPQQKFVLFDVRVGNWWLKREDILEIAQKLGLEVVPIVEGVKTIYDAIRYVRDDKVSHWGNFKPEGLVGTPKVPLFTRNGDRVITKVKGKDFTNL